MLKQLCEAGEFEEEMMMGDLRSMALDGQVELLSWLHPLATEADKRSGKAHANALDSIHLQARDTAYHRGNHDVIRWPHAIIMM